MKPTNNYRDFYSLLKINLDLTRDEFSSLIIDLYGSPMSSCEIVEFLLSSFGIDITSRSIQRILKASGIPIRSRSESFRLAIKKGRVKFQKSERTKLSRRPKITFNRKLTIFRERDWKCSQCPYQNPNDYDFSTLILDHITPFFEGGSDNDSNLQILCTDCHGKKTKKEQQDLVQNPKRRGGAISGRSLEVRLATR